ncbi:MAG: DUF4974 domain-containing protein [Chlorobi bacterium]|nr:DUF4974 domain-containing protein [Chlorobiota bacterium]
MTRKEQNISQSDFYEKAGKLLSGEMKEKEAEQFVNNQDEQNLDELEKLKKLWKLSETIKLYQSIDVTRAASKIERKLNDNNKRILLFFEKVAAILFLPLLITSIIYFNINRPVNYESTFNEIDNSFGTVSKLILPDGTKVWLNSGSHFKYPLIFKRKMRKVFLSGEAYFEVAKDKKRPFIVQTDDIDVMATGTKFDVLAYDNDNLTEATLVEGTIYIAKDNGDNKKPTPIACVKPGQKATLHKDRKKLTVQKTNIDKTISWIDGKLIFINDPMNEVIKKLSRWFNADIILVDNELTSYRYTATFTEETLPQILDLLKRSAPIEYKIYPRKKNNDNSYTKEKIEIRLRKK